MKKIKKLLSFFYCPPRAVLPELSTRSLGRNKRPKNVSETKRAETTSSIVFIITKQLHHYAKTLRKSKATQEGAKPTS